MNTFELNITPSEQETLTKAIEGTNPNWQFSRKGKYLYAWKPAWEGIRVGGKAPTPLKMKSARGLADRIRLYEDGRNLVKGRGNEAIS